MSNENKKIRFLKALRKSLIGRNSNEEKNEIIQFYEDSLKLNNVANGMAIIITKDNVLYEKTPKNISHRIVAQELCDTLPGEHIDLSKAIYSEKAQRYYFYELSYEIANTAIFKVPHTGMRFQWILLLAALSGFILIGYGFNKMKAKEVKTNEKQEK
jgi:hypothetical protein